MNIAFWIAAFFAVSFIALYIHMYLTGRNCTTCKKYQSKISRCSSSGLKINRPVHCMFYKRDLYDI